MAASSQLPPPAITASPAKFPGEHQPRQSPNSPARPGNRQPTTPARRPSNSSVVKRTPVSQNNVAPTPHPPRRGDGAPCPPDLRAAPLRQVSTLPVLSPSLPKPRVDNPLTTTQDLHLPSDPPPVPRPHSLRPPHGPRAPDHHPRRRGPRPRAPDRHLGAPGLPGGAGALRTAEHDAAELAAEAEEEVWVPVEEQDEEREEDAFEEEGEGEVPVVELGGVCYGVASRWGYDAVGVVV